MVFRVLVWLLVLLLQGTTILVVGNDSSDSYDDDPPVNRLRAASPCPTTASFRCYEGNGYMMHYWEDSNDAAPICHESCIPINLVSTMLDTILSTHWRCGVCAMAPPPTPSSTTSVQQIGATNVWSATGRNMRISRPVDSKPGDLLVLILSRTDSYIPLVLPGWKAGPTCLKSRNRQLVCHTTQDCVQWKNRRYCESFYNININNNNAGQDLSIAVFYKIVTRNEPWEYSFNLLCQNECHPGLAILSALRGADPDYPFGESAGLSYDGSRQSHFPSVRGREGDKLLLISVFDDGVATGVDWFSFQPPTGTALVSAVIGKDEAGFLFEQDLQSSGSTGRKQTKGPGDEPDKDAMISLVVRKKRI